jgi:uncharacterized protein with NRDE domain
MCLMLFAYRVHPEYPLVVAANRDEFHRRPSAPAQWWNAPDILAGRDLEAGGSWMGVNRRGRFAAVTNFRDPPAQRPGLRSRGALIVETLQDARPGEAVLQDLQSQGQLYNGFNLVFGGIDGVFSYASRDGAARALTPGLYGLSNHLLETPWPKVVRGKAKLEQYLDSGAAPALAPLLELLADRASVPDEELPQTGVSLDWERRLAPMFIVSPDYGTRASTALIMHRDGRVWFAERSFGADGEAVGIGEFRFTVPPAE